MFCDQCGFSNADGVQFCSRCGRSFAPAAVQGFGAPFPPVDSADQKTDGKAVLSMVLGILSLTLFWILAGIPAVILGHISRSKIKKSLGHLKGDGMALAGLIMGYLSIAALPFVLIIAAIAIPNLLRARTAANEASAVASIRTIVTAAATYKQVHPTEGYPGSLQAMRAAGAPLIDAQLASGLKQGYHFVYEVRNMTAEGNGGYFVRAIPNVPNNTGRREFCAEDDGVIHSTTVPETCTGESAALY
jgi:type II secretory pathway pseudopilin PulG